MLERLDALRRRFRALGVANFLVTRLSNIRYLCGYTGSNGILMVTGHEAYFITDGRYTNQAREQVKGAQVFIYSSGNTPAEAFTRELKSNKNIRFRGRVGIEAQILTVDLYQMFIRTFPNCTTVETANVVEKVASIKDETEINQIRQAVEITDKVFQSILADVKPGVRENELSAEITYRHKKLGASGDAFETIVASGPRSAMPHGIASDRRIQKGDFITFDMGCKYNGYHSDMTRTVVLGKATKKQKEVYQLVKDCQERSIEAVAAGVKCADMDAFARKIFTDAGYGEYFTHSLGHGLGLEIHAYPRLSAVSDERLQNTMVVTIEPGLYIDGYGGVRIEDDVVVRDSTCEVLNKSPKELIEL